jgi:hypothetical protein
MLLLESFWVLDESNLLRVSISAGLKDHETYCRR